MKMLKCSEIGFDCAAVVNGETVEAVLAQAAAHAQEVHGMAVTAKMAKEIPRRISGR